jgi:hypothetical protein
MKENTQRIILNFCLENSNEKTVDNLSARSEAGNMETDIKVYYAWIEKSCSVVQSYMVIFHTYAEIFMENLLK